MGAQVSIQREITQARMTQVFVDYVRRLGIKPSGVAIRFESGRMIGYAQSLGWRMFGVRGFAVVGRFTVRDGCLHFILEDLSPSVPFTRFVAPRIDTIAGALVSDLDVTGVEVGDGSLIVTGIVRKQKD